VFWKLRQGTREAKEEIVGTFKMKDMGNVSKYLGIKERQR
jgi:hypothetical protein